MGWTPGEHSQAEDRAHRIGQEGNVQVFYLVAKGTIEEQLCKLVHKKQAVLSSTLDGGSGDTFDVFGKLEKILIEEGKSNGYKRKRR